ncbi:MAG: hypothetical protein K2J48_06605, partial [Muribaculaceae bacterium]|nr:hypothetical protein [Muribaculaceae bacterium]
MKLKPVAYTLLLLFSLLPLGCIKNDLPYPKIQQNITRLAAEGQSKDALIDSVDMKAVVYLEETTDIENVKFTEFSVSEGGKSDVNLLEGSYNLTSPLN